MRRGNALLADQRRVRSSITLCQRHTNALLGKKDNAQLNAQLILFFSGSATHTLTPCLRGEGDPGRPNPINNSPSLTGLVYVMFAACAFSLVFCDAFAMLF